MAAAVIETKPIEKEIKNESTEQIESVLTDVQKQLMKAIEENKVEEFKKLVESHPKEDVNFIDDDKMTPLQQAAYRGNTEIVKILLNKGADVNKCEHENEYTTLHFAALSGNVDVCHLLLAAGVKMNALNSINRTPAQLASFVGYHSIVGTINNFIPKEDVEYYTKIQGTQTKPHLTPKLADSLYKLALLYNLHPIKVAMLVQQYEGLLENIDEVGKVFELMSEREMKRKECNEVLAFKFHYIFYVLHEIARQMKLTVTDKEKKPFLDQFAKKLLKRDKSDKLEYLDGFVRESIRIFPFIDSTLFRQMVGSLSGDNAPQALQVMSAAINGQRAFADDIIRCETCNEEKATKKCAKCKEAAYCDRECQRLHWFDHKKTCGKKEIRKVVDANELSDDIKGLLN